MAPPTKQVRLPFDRLTEANLKPIVKKFEKWGVKIAEIDAPNKAKRESGSLIKEVMFTFDDSQKVLIRVKADGTVFQVRLNSRPVPIKHMDDLDKSIVEIVDAVQGNAKAFARNRITQAKVRNTPKPPPVTTTRQEKLAVARTELQELTAAVAELEAREGELQKTVDERRTELEQTKSALELEKARTIRLESELKTLTNAV